MLAWCALIFFLSHQPNLDLQHLTPEFGYADLLDKPLRKLGHVAEYAILFLLARRHWKPGPAWVFCVLFAVSDEWHQTFVPGRMGKVSDILLDSGAAGLPIAVKLMLRRLENR